jgi:uncharacterized protein (TIGR03435 family)
MRSIGTLLVAAMSLCSQSVPANRPSFDVASVKPYKDSGVGPRNAHSTYGPQSVNFGARTVAFLIAEAYNVMPGRIVPAETRAKTETLAYLREGYDVVAKAEHPVSKADLRLMLQSLLTNRFALALHREMKTERVYKLVVAKGGPKLEASQDDGDLLMEAGPEGFVFRNAKVYRLAGYLSSFLDRTVVDATGLSGLYNFVVKVPEELRVAHPVKSERSPDSSSSALFADVLKPLGLELVAGLCPVEYLVVDHLERATEN